MYAFVGCYSTADRNGHGTGISTYHMDSTTGAWELRTVLEGITNPSQNIMAGAKYLKYLTDRFNGDQQKAIAAYNAGEGNVRRFGGVPPFRETRNYVQRVRSFQHDLGDRLQSHVAELGGPTPGL